MRIQKLNQMIIFIKKIKTKEGINSFDTDKIKKGVPAGYKVSAEEPIITLTANHVMVAYKCEKVEKPTPVTAPKANKAVKANNTPKAEVAPKGKSMPKAKAANKKTANKKPAEAKKAVEAMA